MLSAEQIRLIVKNAPKVVRLLASARAAVGDVDLQKIRDYIPVGARRTSPLTFAAWFGAGVVTGATATLMLTPKRGEEMRAEVKKLFESLSEVLLQPEEQQEAPPREPASNGADQDAVAEPSLSSLSKEELYRRAQEAGIKGRSQMDKDELIAALNGQ